MWYLTNAFRSATVAPPTFDALRFADLQVLEAISRTACSAATAAARSAADRSARLAIESSGPPTPGALVAEANHGSAQAVLQQKRIQTVMNQSDGNQIKMTAIFSHFVWRAEQHPVFYTDLIRDKLIIY